MIIRTDVFYNFLMSNYDIFKEQDETTLKQAWSLYKNFCDEGRYDWRLNMGSSGTSSVTTSPTSQSAQSQGRSGLELVHRLQDGQARSRTLARVASAVSCAVTRGIPARHDASRSASPVRVIKREATQALG